MTRSQTERRTSTPKRWAVLAAAVGAGVGAGLLGTSLHGHAWYPGGAESAIPYGSALALLLLAAVSMFVGLWSKSSWISVWCGAAAYATAGLLSLQLGTYGLIFDNTQGRVWLYGIAFITPLVALIVWRLLLPKK
ncbi:hypothetical protein [Arthrobacter sp. TWP1-1]|uniref:hypothetical protein n=1 Tax=Arthrobacter sp. TWP1-1 TaxID=2804568 RepID=UPI003CF7582F